MKPVLSIEETLRLEDLIEREGTSKAALMEHAGEAAAARVAQYKPQRVAVHSYAGHAAAALMGERSVIATDLIDVLGEAMNLTEREALRDAGIELGD